MFNEEWKEKIMSNFYKKLKNIKDKLFTVKHCKQNEQSEQDKIYSVIDIFSLANDVDLSDTVAFQNLLTEQIDVILFMDILEKRKQFVSPMQYTKDLLWAFDLANSKMLKDYNVKKTEEAEETNNNKTIL